MKGRLILVSLVALVTLALGGSGVLAASGQEAARGVPYVFSGTLLSDPPSGSTSISVRVETGNRRALQRLVGHNQDQALAVSGETVFLRWANGVPAVVSLDALQAGDWVTVRVRAPRGSSLAEVTTKPAATVASRADRPGPARLPLWRFEGTLAAPAGSGSLALTVTSGNWKALHAMLGQPLQQTFSFDASTIFLRWQGRVPTVISAGQLGAGDRISIKIRAPRGSALEQLRSIPARKVADREPPAPEGA